VSRTMVEDNTGRTARSGGALILVAAPASAVSVAFGTEPVMRSHRGLVTTMPSAAADRTHSAASGEHSIIAVAGLKATHAQTTESARMSATG
jgi:hypothetical protein